MYFGEYGYLCLELVSLKPHKPNEYLCSSGIKFAWA